MSKQNKHLFPFAHQYTGNKQKYAKTQIVFWNIDDGVFSRHRHFRRLDGWFLNCLTS
jgi:hypothetical protein